jgi:hypothetical protein
MIKFHLPSSGLHLRIKIIFIPAIVVSIYAQIDVQIDMNIYIFEKRSYVQNSSSGQ